MTSGNPFRLAQYDKSRRQGSGAAPSQDQAPAISVPDAWLNPPTICSLQVRIRALLAPQLAAFSRAFRSAFQVPAGIPSIAGLLTEQRHRVCIQEYLSQS